MVGNILRLRPLRAFGLRVEDMLPELYQGYFQCVQRRAEHRARDGPGQGLTLAIVKHPTRYTLKTLLNTVKWCPFANCLLNYIYIYISKGVNTLYRGITPLITIIYNWYIKGFNCIIHWNYPSLPHSPFYFIAWLSLPEKRPMDSYNIICSNGLSIIFPSTTTLLRLLLNHFRRS